MKDNRTVLQKVKSEIELKENKLEKYEKKLVKSCLKNMSSTNRRRKKNMRTKRNSLIYMSTSAFTMIYREKKQEN